MQPPSPQQIIERAEREGRGTVTVSLRLFKQLVETEATLVMLAEQTGIIDNDTRLGSSWS